MKCYIDSEFLVDDEEIIKEIDIARIPAKGEHMWLESEEGYSREVIKVTFIEQHDHTWTPCVELGRREKLKGRFTNRGPDPIPTHRALFCATGEDTKKFKCYNELRPNSPPDPNSTHPLAILLVAHELCEGLDHIGVTFELGMRCGKDGKVLK